MQMFMGHKRVREVESRRVDRVISRTIQMPLEQVKLIETSVSESPEACAPAAAPGRAAMMRVMVCVPREDYGEMASYRLRVGALIEPMRERGYEWVVRVRPKGIRRRWAFARSVREFDAVILHRTLVSWYEALAMRWSLKRPKPIFVDVDDAIMVGRRERGRASQWRLNMEFRSTARIADQVCAGNDSLLERFAPFGCAGVRVATVVDPAKYVVKRHRAASPLGLVWIGSGATLGYLEQIMPMLGEAHRKIGLKLIVIANRPPKDPPLPIEFIRWSESSEAEALALGDIGIAPTPLDKWTPGKSGFKIVQYMAAGLPVIASPVGVNVELVNGGAEQECVGLLADSAGQWMEAIEKLAGDVETRRRYGAAARQRVERDLCIERAVEQWARVLSRVRG